MAAVTLVPPVGGAEASIRFVYRPVDFTLESSETPDRHVPEIVAGGVGVFDYDNDGLLDLFRANYLVWDAATEPKCQDTRHTRADKVGQLSHPFGHKRSDVLRPAILSTR